MSTSLSNLHTSSTIGNRPPELWVVRAEIIWKERRLLSRITGIAFVLSLVLALCIPKRYTSMARIMPPDQQGSGALLLAALTSHSSSLGGLGSLAGNLIGGHPSTALFIELLHSGTVSGNLIRRFELQHVYRTRYLIDTAKRLARRTSITDEKRSGVITISVEDNDPVRARDLAQGYLDELNNLVVQTSTSSAHQERVFIERRLKSVTADLETAQLGLSEFASRNGTIDIGSQTKAMVDAAARLQAEVLVEQSGLEALRQIYGDGNVRVRETEARIASLQRELAKLSGSSKPLKLTPASSEASEGQGELYPPLRQIPRLAVPYANLYRRVKVQETVFELLTQQYEISRIEEAKDVPVVNVLDAPGIPEKKSFPPRLILIVSLTALCFLVASTVLLMRDHWHGMEASDPRKLLVVQVLSSLRRDGRTE